MVKKRELNLDYVYDFDLIGMVSSLKSHRLAWEIGKALGLGLCRSEDLIVQLEDQMAEYAHFCSKTAPCRIRLFKNQPHGAERLARCTLIPEYSYLDYIFMSQGEQRPDLQRLSEDLGRLETVEMLIFIPLDFIKFKRFFIL